MSSLLRRQLEASLAHERTLQRLAKTAGVKLVPRDDDNSKIEIGFRQVQDPYGQDGEQLTVAVNIKSDMVENLYQRGKIDHAQFTAGRYFLALVEKAEGSSFLVPDMAREPVDSSLKSFSVPDFRLDAQTQLIRVARYLGGRDYRLARRYLARDLEAYPEPPSRSEREYHSRRMRDILEDLAKFWGFAGDEQINR